MRLSTKLLFTTCVTPALIWLVGIYVVKTSQDQLRGAIQTAAMAEVRSMQEEIDRLLRARTNTWEKFSRDEEVIASLVDKPAPIEPTWEEIKAQVGLV